MLQSFCESGALRLRSGQAEIPLREGARADLVLVSECKMLQRDYLVARDSFIANEDSKSTDSIPVKTQK